tara:strand:- start:69 stop:218 length:150 start_codon:yes stop_codon:yes gene_type:complete
VLVVAVLVVLVMMLVLGVQLLVDLVEPELKYQLHSKILRVILELVQLEL